MKKKETLAIFILAVLLIILSLLFKDSSTYSVKYGWPLPFLEDSLICPSFRPQKPPGEPNCYVTGKNILFVNCFLNLFFWFGVVLVGWQVVKIINRSRVKKV